MSDWISVEDRLPTTEKQNVLVWTNGKGGKNSGYKIACFEIGGFYAMNHIWRMDVTHWLPLPEAPTKETTLTRQQIGERERSLEQRDELDPSGGQ